MSSFGGVSPGSNEGFSGSSVIKSFLVNNQVDFTNMVTSYSILLEGYKQNTSEVIRVAQVQVYPRIGLLLCAARNLDNTFLFSDDPNVPQLDSTIEYTAPGYTQAQGIFLSLINNVIDFITSPNSAFSEGITSVAAALTAVVLIRQIPINSDIKNIELGAAIEKEALADLERIVGLKAGTSKSTSVKNSVATTATTATFYISLDINSSTIPLSLINVEPVSNPALLDSATPQVTISMLPYLTIPSTEVAYCYYYLSAQEGESIIVINSDVVAQSTSQTVQVNPVVSVPPPIEGAFFIEDGWTADQVTENLADNINSDCLVSQSTGGITNIIASPNRGENILTSVVVPKKKLFDNPSSTPDPYERKLVAFSLVNQVNHINVATRRHSDITSKELLIVKFYSTNKQALANYIYNNTSLSTLSTNPNPPSFNYLGTFNPTTNYIYGDLVDYSGGLYFRLTPSVPNPPAHPIPGNAGYWYSIYTQGSDLLQYKNVSSITNGYIDGLIYGLSPLYGYMDKRGPKSVIIATEKGQAKAITTHATTSSSKTQNTIDTFWFQIAPGATSINGTLKIRVSSTNLTAYPQIYAYVDASTNAVLVPLNAATVEDVCIQIIQALYPISQYTKILPAYVNTGIVSSQEVAALEFTAFTETNYQVTEVIDILSEVPGLEIATGTSLVTKTSYSTKPRSLIITAVPIKVSSATSGKVALDNNQDYQASASISKGRRRSDALQAQLDKLDYLKKLNKRETPGYNTYPYQPNGNPL